MKKQKLSNLYPTASRGSLKSSSAVTAQPPEEHLSRAKDRSPDVIIAMGALAASVLGLCMLVIVYLYLR